MGYFIQAFKEKLAVLSFSSSPLSRGFSEETRRGMANAIREVRQAGIQFPVKGKVGPKTTPVFVGHSFDPKKPAYPPIMKYPSPDIASAWPKPPIPSPEKKAEYFWQGFKDALEKHSSDCSKLLLKNLLPK